MSNLLFYTNKPTFGLEINSTSIKAMSINPKTLKVGGYGSIDIEPLKMAESIENNDSYLSDQISKLLKDNFIGTLPSRRAMLGIPTIKTFSRTFVLPRKAEKNLRDAVLLEVDQYVPLPRETLYINHQIIDRNKDNVTVLLNAAPRKYLDAICRSVKNAKVQTIMIETNINAIARVLNRTEGGTTLPTVVVDIGAASTDIAVLDGGMIRVTGGVAVGGNTFTINIAKKLDITLENAYQLKVINGLGVGSRQRAIKDALKPSLDDIVREIKRVMRYYKDRVAPDVKFEQLLIVGNGANTPGLGEYMTNELVIAARVAVPWQKLNFEKIGEPPKQVKPQLIAAAGLAGLSPKEIDFND